MKAIKLIGAALLSACSLTVMAQSQGDPVLYGYQHNPYYPAASTGMYLITPTGTNADLLWNDQLFSDNGYTTNNVMLAGWIRNGALCGVQSQYPIPSQSYYKYVERDLATGQVIKEESIDLSNGWTNVFLNAAYCPDDDRVYGYGFNAGRTGFVFKSAPADNLSQAVIIKELPDRSYPGSICYNPETGGFYGVMNVKGDYGYTNNFVSIDVNTGGTTTLFTLNPGPESDYKCVGGMIWVPARQAYLWNYYTMFDGDNPCSQLIEINPQTKQTTLVKSFNQTNNFFYFVSENNEPIAAAGAPGAVTDFVANVASDNTANVSFTLPIRLANGNAISGDVSYTIYVDGNQTKTGSGASGSTVNYSVKLSDGTHFLRVIPAVNGVNGLAEINVIYIGEDSPRAPENIVLTTADLSWDAVDQGIAGNALSGVKYRVVINGMTVTETTATHFDVSDVVITDGPLTNYRAEVYALCGGRSSKAGYSNSLIVGKPWTVPFSIQPTEADFSLMIQDDVDGNNVGWTLDKDQYSDVYALTSGFSRYTESEDWIFLPKFTASADKVYTFTFSVYLADSELPGGKVETWIGDGPSKSSMKKVITPGIRVLQNNDGISYTGEFVADGSLAGKDLYIGIGVTSKAGVLSPLRFQSMSVRESGEASVAGPAAVGDLVATPNAEDNLLSDISFTMPTTTVNGQALPADATVKATVKVLRGTSGTVEGKPGEKVNITLSAGNGEYMVTVTPEYNGTTGLSSCVVSTVGQDLPGVVRNIRYAYDSSNCALHIQWDAPDTDVNGNPAADDVCNYNVWAFNNETGDFELAVTVNYPLTFATMQMENNTTLQDLNIAITAINITGESTERALAVCQVGTPHQLPISDDLNGNDFRFGPITNYVGAPYDKATIEWNNPTVATNWGLSDEMAAADGDVLCGIPAAPGAKTRFDLPKVSTQDYKDVCLQLNIYTGTDAATTTIKGNYPGNETIVWNDITFYPQTMMDITTIEPGNGYQDLKINLPEQFNNQPWISVIFETLYPTLASRFLLAGYSLTAVSGVDNVATTLYGTITGGQGVVNICGYDGETANVYTLDGRLAASQAVSGSSTEVSVPAGLYVVKVGQRVAKVVVK